MQMIIEYVQNKKMINIKQSDFFPKNTKCTKVGSILKLYFAYFSVDNKLSL